MKKRLRSFMYAFAGIRYLFSTQPNARIHLLASALVITLGILLKISTTEWAILSVTIGAVLAAEAFNTAIEALTDLSSPDRHPLAGAAKDAAAAAVLLTAIASIATGIFVLGPKLLRALSL
jgi:diacylglycerol kinase (ATP)